MHPDGHSSKMHKPPTDYLNHDLFCVVRRGKNGYRTEATQTWHDAEPSCSRERERAVANTAVHMMLDIRQEARCVVAARSRRRRQRPCRAGVLRDVEGWRRVLRRWQHELAPPSSLTDAVPLRCCAQMPSRAPRLRYAGRSGLSVAAALTRTGRRRGAGKGGGAELVLSL
jgi:hypothetical protein